MAMSARCIELGVSTLEDVRRAYPVSREGTTGTGGWLYSILHDFEGEPEKADLFPGHPFIECVYEREDGTFQALYFMGDEKGKIVLIGCSTENPMF